MPLARTLVAAVLLAMPALPAKADPTDFLQRFDGSFSGSGTVLRDVDPSPRNVSCRLEGSRPSPTSLTIDGTCRAAVIFTREIGAEISVDASGTFSGVYRGAATGPARLSGGQLNGDTLTMRLTYGAPIYGDSDATMTITNAGQGGFTMTVTDEIDGQTVQTSHVTLTSG